MPEEPDRTWFVHREPQHFRRPSDLAVVPCDPQATRRWLRERVEPELPSRFKFRDADAPAWDLPAAAAQFVWADEPVTVPKRQQATAPAALGGLNVSYQLLESPLLIPAVRASRVEAWPTGSEVAFVTHNPRRFHQVVLVRPLGLMLNLTAHGLRERPPPILMSALTTLMQRLDTTELDRPPFLATSA